MACLTTVARLSLAFLAATSLSAATLSWSGGGSTGYWNDSGNWGFAGTPASGDTLVFPASQPRLNNTNNLSSLVLAQIRFAGAGGGYTISGNGFTITNGIYATNTTGVNTISNSIVLATINQPMNVASGATLVLVGPILGTVGVTKQGAGTLRYSGASDNGYNGPTVVNEGVLELNKSSIWWAISQNSLTIGDGVGGDNADVVRYISTGTDQIASGVTITINSSGLLDLNNHSDTVGNITMVGGEITTGTGTITVGDITATAGGAGDPASIGGRLYLSTMRTFNMLGLTYSPALVVSASISGPGGLNLTGRQGLRLENSNSYAGLTIVSSNHLRVDNSYALGDTAGGTVVSNGAGLILAFGVNVGNEPLSLAGPGNGSMGALWSVNLATTSWSGPITLREDTVIGVVSATGQLTLSGAISGPGGFTKVGEGTLVLAGPSANSFGGNLYVQAGRLDLNKPGGAGIPYPNRLIIGGTTNAAEARELADYQTDFVQVDRSGLLNLNGYVDFLADLELLNGGDVATGAGRMVLGSGCKVLVADPLGIGTSSISGSLELTTADHSFNVTNGGVLYIQAKVTGSGGLTKAGPVSMYLMNSNAYTGLTVVQDGYLRVQNAWALGTTNNGTVVSNGASLVLEGSFGITNESLTLNGTGQSSGWGALDAETAGTNFWTGPITLNADSTIAPYGGGTHLRLMGAISGSGGLTKGPGTGTLYLDGNIANTYAGTTRVNSGTLVLNKAGLLAVPDNLVISGTVRLARDQQIADSADVLVNSGALFDFGVNAEHFDTLRGGGTVNFGDGGWIYLGLNNGSSTFDGLFTGVGYAPGWTVGKTGSGTFTMNGTNTFTAGHLRILQGTVLANGYQPQCPVRLDSGATLGGSGTVGIILGSGRVAPGTSAGCLTSSNLFFSATGNLRVELNGTTACSGYDQLIVRGTNNLGNATLDVLTAFPPGKPAIGDQFIIINNDGGDPITGTFSGLPNNTTFAVGDIGFRINYDGGDGNDVTLTAISAPGASVTLNASDRGWYDSTGSHSPGNLNYYVGENDGGSSIMHNWFVFNVPVFTGTVVQAELLIHCYTNVSPFGQETYVLRHVATPVGALTAGGTGLTNIYNDLADGPVYAVRKVFVSERGQRAIIPLNVTFINTVTAAMGSQIALGGALASLRDPLQDQQLFSYSGIFANDVQLRLTFGTATLVDAVTTGWYNDAGFHNAGNRNYLAGREFSQFRNFFVFPLPAWSAMPSEVQLLVNSYYNVSPTGALDFRLHEVTTPLALLTNNATGATGTYADLGDGVLYGGREVYVSESNTKLSLPLNHAFRVAAHLQGGNPIALGGAVALSPGDSIEYLFGNSSGVPGDAQLWFGFIPSSLPTPFFHPGSPVHLGNNRYQFVLTATADTTNEIQASMDYINWDAVRSLYMTNDTTTFYHTNPAVFPYRFFRARQLQ